MTNSQIGGNDKATVVRRHMPEAPDAAIVKGMHSGGNKEVLSVERMATPHVASATRRRTLVTWSGGLDSTYGLVRMLKETEDEIHVHHIHRFAPHDDRGTPAQSPFYERDAIAKMLPIIRSRYRNFTYSESLVDNTTFSRFAPDAATVLLMAGCVAKKLGLGPEDRILDVVNRDEDTDWQPGSMAARFLRANSLQILKLIYRGEEIPELYTYDGIPTKQEEADYLPSDLVAMNASCRAPALVSGGWKRCGVCRKCRSFARMKLKLSGDSVLDGSDNSDRTDKVFKPKRIVERRYEGVRKRLVMWSGGQASTKALTRYLTETTDPVHVHHIKCSSRFDRQPDECFGGHAWPTVSEHLRQLKQNHRPFSFTVSTIGPQRVVRQTHILSIVAFYAAQAANSWRMESGDRIVLGGWGDPSDEVSAHEGLYASGALIAPQMLKAIMRSEDGPHFILCQKLQCQR